MDIEPQKSAGMQRVAELVKRAGVVMLTSIDEAGQLVSRPMHPRHIDADGSIRFFTSMKSEKLSQLGRVNIAVANIPDSDYISLSGTSAIELDREVIDALWTSDAKPWFPEGKDDPDLTVLRVDVDLAEFWDATNSRMVQLAALARARVTGHLSHVLKGDHGVVRNGGH